MVKITQRTGRLVGEIALSVSVVKTVVSLKLAVRNDLLVCAQARGWTLDQMLNHIASDWMEWGKEEWIANATGNHSPLPIPVKISLDAFMPERGKVLSISSS